MPIASTDILLKWSAPSATAGNTSANTTAGTSLGGFVATSVLVDATLDNLFGDVTGDENANDNADYQCIFVHNNHATLTLQNAVAWLASEVAGGANTSLGVDPTAPSLVGVSTAQAVTIANKNTAPAGVAFSSPTTKAAGVSVGNVGPGQVRAVWVRRTATNSAAQNNDGVTIRIEGDTAA